MDGKQRFSTSSRDLFFLDSLSPTLLLSYTRISCDCGQYRTWFSRIPPMVECSISKQITVFSSFIWVVFVVFRRILTNLAAFAAGEWLLQFSSRIDQCFSYTNAVSNTHLRSKEENSYRVNCYFRGEIAWAIRGSYPLWLVKCSFWHCKTTCLISSSASDFSPRASFSCQHARCFFANFRCSGADEWVGEAAHSLFSSNTLELVRQSECVEGNNEWSWEGRHLTCVGRREGGGDKW